MTEKTVEETTEADGRAVKMDIGYYSVGVWGDPGDSFEELHEELEAAAERAMRDLKELDDAHEGDDRQFG